MSQIIELFKDGKSWEEICELAGDEIVNLLTENNYAAFQNYGSEENWDREKLLQMLSVDFSGREEVLQEIIQLQISDESPVNCALLRSALSKEDRVLAKKLLEAASYPTKANIVINYPLLFERAVEISDSTLVEEFLKIDADSLRALISHNNFAAFYTAVELGHEDIISLFIDYAPLDLRIKMLESRLNSGSRELSAIEIITKRDSVEIIKKFIDSTANPLTKAPHNNIKLSVFLFATLHGKNKVFDYIMDSENDELSAKLRRAEIMHQPNFQGLRNSIKSKNTYILEKLLQYLGQLSPAIISSDNFNLIRFALHNHDLPSVRILCHHASQPLPQDLKGDIFYEIAQIGDSEMITEFFRNLAPDFAEFFREANFEGIKMAIFRGELEIYQQIIETISGDEETTIQVLSKSLEFVTKLRAFVKEDGRLHFKSIELLRIACYILEDVAEQRDLKMKILQNKESDNFKGLSTAISCDDREMTALILKAICDWGALHRLQLSEEFLQEFFSAIERGSPDIIMEIWSVLEPQNKEELLKNKALSEALQSLRATDLVNAEFFNSFLGLYNSMEILEENSSKEIHNIKVLREISMRLLDNLDNLNQLHGDQLTEPEIKDLSLIITGDFGCHLHNIAQGKETSLGEYINNALDTNYAHLGNDFIKKIREVMMQEFTQTISKIDYEIIVPASIVNAQSVEPVIDERESCCRQT